MIHSKNIPKKLFEYNCKNILCNCIRLYRRNRNLGYVLIYLGHPVYSLYITDYVIDFFTHLSANETEVFKL